jgi:hypothetical protein
LIRQGTNVVKTNNSIMPSPDNKSRGKNVLGFESPIKKNGRVILEKKMLTEKK